MAITDEVIERLEAEAKVSDAEPEELTVAVASDVEETAERVDELSAEVEEKESEVEELQEEITTVKEFYAEELADATPTMDQEEFEDRYTVAELREKFDGLEDESKPAPNSADSGPAVQSPEDEPEGEEAVEELSEMEGAAAEAFRNRANITGKSYWNDIADDIESSDEEN